MAASRTRRSRRRPSARAIAAVAVALALMLVAGAIAPAPGGAYDVSVDPSAIPRIPCGTPEGELIDFWCGDWATDPPALPAQPQQAFRPFGSLRLERIAKAQSDLLRGRPFGDVRIDSTCGVPALSYAGTYEGGQVVACTAGDEVLEGVYREDAPGDLRSGSFDIFIPRTPRTFAGILHQTGSGAPANDWSGQCTGGWCASVVRPPGRLKCQGQPATIVGELDPFETNVILGTPKNDVIVGTDEADLILGRAGNDLICGRGGRDVIVGNRGRDRLDGGAGDDLLRSSSRPGGTEFLDGGAGADQMRGGAGRDVMDPGPGRDTVVGGGGRDIVGYLEASSRVQVNLGLGRAVSRATGGDRLIGIEAVYGSQFDDVLVGGDGEDELNGSGGDDRIRGLGGTDLLIGGNGDDLLDGGAGDDQGIDGSGNTRCRSIEFPNGCDRVLR